MKLAEALQERADLNRKIEELRRRLGNVLLVQEGEEPAEDPTELLNELDGAILCLSGLQQGPGREMGAGSRDAISGAAA